jgi:hypothetical protein
MRLQPLNSIRSNYTERVYEAFAIRERGTIISVSLFLLAGLPRVSASAALDDTLLPEKGKR